jgi:putative alpha-1,2-mannosidase
MSAWYIFNALGFYPMNPASAEYMVGSPLFDSVTVRLPLAPQAPQAEEHTLTITAAGAAAKMYVSGLSVDGAPVQSPLLCHEDLLRAEKLDFVMAAEPQTWGAGVL